MNTDVICFWVFFVRYILFALFLKQLHTETYNNFYQFHFMEPPCMPLHRYSRYLKKIKEKIGYNTLSVPVMEDPDGH